MTDTDVPVGGLCSFVMLDCKVTPEPPKRGTMCHTQVQLTGTGEGLTGGGVRAVLQPPVTPASSRRGKGGGGGGGFSR